MTFMHHDLILAYLDPGSGSLIIQAVIGALVGGAVVVRAKFGQLSAAVRRIVTRTKTS
jgi:hypothetical protein